MTTSAFLNFPGPASAADACHAAFVDGPLTMLTASAGLRFVETYRPAADDVPTFQDGPGLPLIVELNFDSLNDAKASIESAAFRAALTPDPSATGLLESATLDVFTPEHYAVPGHPEPPPRAAPLSFVVRYNRPVEDEAEFVDFYTRNHPPLLARFPRIRNVLCYRPVAIELPAGVSSSGAFLGNEVVFDSLGDLNQALASDVLDLVKADGRRFAAFGSNTHHAMERTRVYARSE
ncbi:MAG: EthD family reductase [Gammaproteobacteria bacterium]